MHSDLIAKLEALDGPNWEIEREIGVTIDREQWLTRGRLNLPLPNYSASLDAAIALVERVLGEDIALELLSDVAESAKTDTVNGTLAGLPIALLIATLKALEARDG